MLRAEIDGNEKQWRHYLADFRAEGGCLEVMQVAFHMLTRRRFENTDALREVSRFVKSFNQVAPAEERLPPREAEAVIRGSLGEPHLLAAIDFELSGNITYKLFLALVDDLELKPAAVDRLLLGAEQMLLQVENSGIPLPFRDITTKIVVIGDDKMYWRMR